MDHLKQFEESPTSLSSKSLKEQDSAIAFFPIKPIYAKKILDGEKLFEFRRTSIRKELRYIIIYASSPVKKITGVAKVEFINIASPTLTWNLTKEVAGISRSKYREYFQGRKRAIAIKLKDVVRLKNVIEPIQISREFSIPQSFSYVDEMFLKKVLNLGF